MSYTIKFLDDDEFEQLPAQDIQSKVGVAYPDSGEAFVRKSGVSAVDTFTAIHELEHLQGNDLDEHFDTENRCYYKNFGQVMQTAAPMLASLIPGIGPVAGPALASTNSFGMFGKSPGQVQQGNQQRDAQGAMGQNMMQEFSSMGQGSPFTSQAMGGSGSSMGSSGGNAIKGLSSQPQFSNQQYGTYNGRDPFHMFNENASGTPLGGAA